ncbi:MAG: class I mannose-6-phosphate isomerase [Planctomycetota bacterium]|nr:class I mannose-6-phosphate isomerase [Planctomycetota bacterium]
MFPAFPPLVFEPLYRSYLWGGRRLASKLGKNLPGDGIWSESWEIVDHPQGQSVVQNGPWQGWTLGRLLSEHREAILGQENLASPQGAQGMSQVTRFPLLLKYLDCQNVLSVQVHPDDAYGLQMASPDLGKTEAWYIIDAEPGSLLYAGLKANVSRKDLVEAIQAGKTEDCLNAICPQAGDCIFIPAGTVHALGAGLLVAEIQQASDCTFRLYDWNRVDAAGNSRALHIDQALEVIDFERGPIGQVSARPIPELGVPELGVPELGGPGLGPQELVVCDKFRLVRFDKPASYALDLPTCRIVTVPKGTARIETSSGSIELRTGESALIPQSCSQASLAVGPETTVLAAEPVFGSAG